MFNKISYFFNNEEPKKTEEPQKDVLKIADELTTQDYKIMFGDNCVGGIKRTNGDWVFKPEEYHIIHGICGIHDFTEDEMYKIYYRLRVLNNK